MDVFAALADPTRRKIVELLARGDLGAGELAAQFEISRPAVSQHLAVLQASGLVSANHVGRRRIYHLKAVALEEVFDWLKSQRRRAKKTAARR